MMQGLNRVAAALVLASTAAAGTASAQTAGSWLVRLGATMITPQVDSGELTPASFPGTTADIESDTAVSGGVTYMWSDQFSIDVPLAAGFTHDIIGTGAIQGVGKIGEVTALPITVLAQYRFFGAQNAFRPYLGIGPTYAKFYDARSTATLTAMTGGTPSKVTTIEVESKWAATIQAGASYAFTPTWSLDASVLKTFLKTRTTLSTGQTLDATLDPLSFSIGVAYKF